MIFKPLPLVDAFLIEMEFKRDSRGYFARTFCLKEFQQFGLITNFVQMSTSFNNKKGQKRGLHYQIEPYSETKVVRCIKGEIYDVIVDLRKNSPTYKKWHGEKLSNKNGKILYIPKGFAHGYKTLEDNTELSYMMDQYYHPLSAREIAFHEFNIDI